MQGHENEFSQEGGEGTREGTKLSNAKQCKSVAAFPAPVHSDHAGRQEAMPAGASSTTSFAAMGREAGCCLVMACQSVRTLLQTGRMTELESFRAMGNRE